MFNATKDIENRTDVISLVNSFYDKIKTDDLLGSIFNNIIKDWASHLPKMYNFWESALFNTGGYSGNAVQAHFSVDHKFPLNPALFERWMNLFTQTVDELFVGEKAEIAKNRAGLMKHLIQIKVAMNQNGKTIV